MGRRQYHIALALPSINEPLKSVESVVSASAKTPGIPF